MSGVKLDWHLYTVTVLLQAKIIFEVRKFVDLVDERSVAYLASRYDVILLETLGGAREPPKPPPLHMRLELKIDLLASYIWAD